MEQKIQGLYFQAVDCGELDFDADSDYQKYLTQTKAVWQGEDMPQPIFDLQDRANFLSFAHGVQFGMRLAVWALKEKAVSAPG